MSEQAKIVRVVVASPADVQAERNAVAAVAEDLNRWIGSLLGIRLEVTRWETDAYPGIHLQASQGLIDGVLRVEDSDLLIGIFWKRFGTPTHDGTTGTEHEIRLACQAWKDKGHPQVMVYFRKHDYTPTTKEETEQWIRLQKFKQAFSTDGLWWPYEGRLDFDRAVRNHLFNFIRENYLSRALRRSPQGSAALCQFQLLPPAPLMLLGREDGLVDLKHRLGIPPSNEQPVAAKRIAVIRGWPGVGKSSIAAALAHDADVHRAYPDGVLWTSVGQKPNIMALLAEWGKALGTDELLRAPGLKDATARLATILSAKRMLLIVDDVWAAEHAAPFQQAQGGECALLFTTRETETAEAIAPVRNGVCILPVLTEESALELLGMLAPSVVSDHPNDSLALVRDLECLPLALHVAGRTLNAEAKMGWGVKDMLAGLRSGVEIIQKKAPADRVDLETQTIPTVATLLRQSTDRLALGCQTPEAQFHILANDSRVQLVAQKSREINERHRLGFRSKPANLGVELVTCVASLREESLRLRVQRAGLWSIVQPVETIGLCQKGLRIRGTRPIQNVWVDMVFK
jgi:hypothetical protein